MELKEKYEGSIRRAQSERKSVEDALGLELEVRRGKALDAELVGLDNKQERSFAQIERLVKVWKEQKQVQGVEDSDTEKRTQVTIPDNFRYCLHRLIRSTPVNGNTYRTWKPSRSV
jgi:hypothetical protein